MQLELKKILATALLIGMPFAASATITVTGTRDFGGATVGTSCNGGSESQQPVILVKDGGIVRNVKLQAGAAADGIHCEGNCRLENVTWADVCEDAATMKGGSGQTKVSTGGSATSALSIAYSAFARFSASVTWNTFSGHGPLHDATTSEPPTTTTQR